MKHTFPAKIRNVKLRFHNPDFIRKFLIDNDGKDVYVSFEEDVPSKTDRQLGYYWGHLIPALCEKMGEFDKEYVHYVLKKKFLIDYKVIKEKTREYIRDMSFLNKKDAAEYIHNVYHLAFEMGAKVHPPEHYFIVKKGNKNES